MSLSASGILYINLSLFRWIFLRKSTIKDFLPHLRDGSERPHGLSQYPGPWPPIPLQT